MPKHTFTDRWLKSVGPFKTTKEFTDNACPNLRLRVGKNKKSFSVMIGSATSRRRLSIGQYPNTSLKDAREKANALLQDPRSPGGGRPRPGGPQNTGTVKQLFEFVIASMEVDGKTASMRDCQRYLLDGSEAAAADFGPETLARNVTPQMVTDWLAKFHKRGRSTRLPRAILSAAFNRGMKADHDPTAANDQTVLFCIDVNPVAVVGGPTQSSIRDRSLSLEEMARFWRDLDEGFFSDGLAAVFKMIIAMGGVRVTEVVRSQKSWWLDEGGWRILKSPKLSLPKAKTALGS